MSTSLRSSTATIDTEFDSSVFEESLETSGSTLKPGSKVRGIVVKVLKDKILLDISCKAEGQIPHAEFGDKVPSEGETIEVIFKGEDAEGNILVSFAELQRAEIEAQLIEGNTVKATICKLLQKKENNEDQASHFVGYIAELCPGITAFVPLSQIDLYSAPPETYLNNTLEFRIERIELKERHRNIVLNRRKLLEEELQNRRNNFFLEHNVGDVVKGQVRSFVNFGAFIDLGGFSGLLHIANIAWHPVKNAEDYLKLGEELELQIIDLMADKNKIGLSLKAMKVSPWADIENKYSEGQQIDGTVVRLQNYGAFVELEPGIEGLVHVSEMSWTRQIKHAKEVLAIGDKVNVQILELNLEQQRMRLGLRQTQSNPWLSISERYPVGTNLTLQVKSIIKGGAFLTLEEGIDGFLHQNDLSWTKQVDIHDIAKIGESLEIQILSIDIPNHRIRLGVKQLGVNPWKELKDFKKKTIIEGTVVGKTDFGLFVSVNGGIEGLIHKNDLTNDRKADLDELLKSYAKGTKVRVLVIEIDEDKRRLRLSIKALEQNEEQQIMQQYLVQNDDTDNGYSLSEVLGKH